MLEYVVSVRQVVATGRTLTYESSARRYKKICIGECLGAPSLFFFFHVAFAVRINHPVTLNGALEIQFLFYLKDYP